MGSSPSKQETTKKKRGGSTALKYCKKHKGKCYGDRCRYKCSNGSIREHCVSRRIDGVLYWSHKPKIHCKTLKSCKLTKIK